MLQPVEMSHTPPGLRLVGLAAGLSRPNVTDLFPNHITTEVRTPFVGGGIQGPLRRRVTLFAKPG